MRFIYVTDPHFRPSYANRLDNVLETFEDKVAQVYELAKKHKAKAIIWGGDIFDNHVPSRTPHWFTVWLIKLFSKAPCPMYSNVGNHDIRYADIETLESQPLGVIFASGVLKRLEVAKFDDVEVLGIDYGIPLDEIEIRPTAKIIVSHHHLSKTKGLFFNETSYGMDQLAENSNAMFWLNGHDHTQYPMEKVGNTLFVRPGAMFRKDTGKASLKHTPSVAVIDTDTGKCNYISLKHEKSDKVFDLTSKNRKITQLSEISAFVDRLEQSIEQEDMSIEDQIKALNLEPEVLACVKHYIEESSSGQKKGAKV